MLLCFFFHFPTEDPIDNFEIIRLNTRSEFIHNNIYDSHILLRKCPLNMITYVQYSILAIGQKQPSGLVIRG